MKRLGVLALGLAGLALLLAAEGTPAQEKKPQEKKPQEKFVPPAGVDAELDVEYGAGGSRPLRMHILKPKDAKEALPVIVWVHGGGWEGGHRDSGLAKLAPYAKDGYVCASIEYRLSPEAKFPAQLEDCKTAINYLRANAKRLNLDPNRIGVWGSSAGGHLVALLGTTGHQTQKQGKKMSAATRVQAVVDFCGPTDLAKLATNNKKADNAITRLIGGTPSEKKGLYEQASPLTHVSKEAPPFLIVHGDMDTSVPLEQSELLEAALKKAGVPVTLHVAKGQGHALGGDEVNKVVTDFFAKTLKAKK